MTKIQISACTYRRPDGLRSLLKSIQDITVPQDMSLSVCIVDNDTEPSAEDLVNQIAATFPWPINYAHEAEPGIPMARNRALDEASDADFIAFVDDDETVEPDWLEALWTMAQRSNADFIQGPVRMTVADVTDAWWLKTLFFKLSEFPDGTPRHESWSNNVLVDLRFVRAHDIRFDETLALDGGTDTLFFQDMVRAGARGVFAANAWVIEEQPSSRLRWKWAMQRQFRYGVTRANTVMMRRGRLTALTHCIFRSGGMAVIGSGLLVSGLVRGRVGLADGIALWSRSIGVLAGMTGHRHREYKRQKP
ncbi:MAG: glycosyltransferase family A protein [Pseudomonadota bacterium]